MKFETTVTIDAAPAKVWAVLVDVERWPTWTKSVQSATRGESGPLQVGSTATVKQPKLAKSRWVVTEVDPGRNFTWVSKAPGVTSVGSHRVDLTPAGGSLVTLTLDQSGPLAAIVGFVGGRLIRRYVGFEAAGLKARAEAASEPDT
jgi:uncharacterized protein YndB with AHSA1/START domain